MLNKVDTAEGVFVARQPIYNRSLDVFSYELLFRSGNHGSAGTILDGNQATTQVILNTFMELGFENVVGHHKAFINLTSDFIKGDFPIPFNKKQVVLEVLEHVRPEPAILQGLESLKAKGFTIALDDFVYDEQLTPFIKLADIIKIDVQVLDDKQLKDHVRKLRSEGIKLLAEKIETKEEFDNCKQLGFDFFQGYFLSKPQVLEGRRLPNSKIALMQILSRLQDPDVEFHELDKLIKPDASLSFKLLRYINSPAVAVSTEVSSIQHALVLLGMDTLKRWVTLIVLSGMAERASEIMRFGMVRAKMCELLATALGEKKTDTYFTVGLFSVLDSLLDLPMYKVLEELPLPTHMNSALLEKKGLEGETLQCAIAYEEGEFNIVGCASLTTSEIKQAYLDAIKWADESMRSIHG